MQATCIKYCKKSFLYNNKRCERIHLTYFVPFIFTWRDYQLICSVCQSNFVANASLSKLRMKLRIRCVFGAGWTACLGQAPDSTTGCACPWETSGPRSFPVAGRLYGVTGPKVSKHSEVHNWWGVFTCHRGEPMPQPGGDRETPAQPVWVRGASDLQGPWCSLRTEQNL